MTPYSTCNWKHTEKAWKTLQNRLKSMENLTFECFSTCLKALRIVENYHQKRCFCKFFAFTAQNVPKHMQNAVFSPKSIWLTIQNITVKHTENHEKQQKRWKAMNYKTFVSPGTRSKAFTKIKISHQKRYFCTFFAFSAENVSKLMKTKVISTKIKFKTMAQFSKYMRTNRVLWAETQFLYVFRLYTTKRAKIHAKRSIFKQIQGVMPNDSLLQMFLETHCKIMKNTAKQVKKHAKLVIWLFFNMFQNTYNSQELSPKTLFLHVFRLYCTIFAKTHAKRSITTKIYMTHYSKYNSKTHWKSWNMTGNCKKSR